LSPKLSSASFVRGKTAEFPGEEKEESKLVELSGPGCFAPLHGLLYHTSSKMLLCFHRKLLPIGKSFLFMGKGPSWNLQALDWETKGKLFTQKMN
jgi:hypothetical protein